MLKYMRKYWFFGLLAALFMCGEVYMDVTLPKMMSLIVDDGILGLSNGGVSDMPFIASLGLRMAALVIMGSIGGIMSGFFEAFCSRNYGNEIRKEAFQKIMSLSIEQTEKFSAGSLITRVTNDITQIQILVRECVRGMVRCGLLFIGGIVSVFMLNREMGIVIICTLPFVVACILFFSKKSGRRFSVLQEKLDYLNHFMQEKVSGVRIVKACVREKYEVGRFQEANTELAEKQLDVLLLLAAMTPIMNIIMNIGVICVIRIGGLQVQAGGATPGAVMAAITYVTMILNATVRMATVFQSIARGMASMKRVREVIECEPILKDGAQSGQRIQDGSIEFQNVSFQYPGSGAEYVLKNLSFTIHAGETFGIMGGTGSGKTTLMQLINRMYDPVEGRVLIDGRDVREYALEEVREKAAAVFQKSELFRGTIEDNIRWGNENADADEVEKAAVTAQAMEFIRSKAKGMQEEVAQGGVSLSGGQRQRLSISRAVVKRAPILLMDDATSALDLKTEAALFAAIGESAGGQTKVIVSQRVASLQKADRILVLDHGRAAALGSPDELLKSSRIYQEIYDSQMNREEMYGSR